MSTWGRPERMNDVKSRISSSHVSQGPRYLVVYLLFFFSGMSGLMYEVVWAKELMLVLGNTVQSTTTILSSFMAGLGVGSLLFGHLADSKRPNPLRLYAILEAGIGLFALAFPFLLQQAGNLYSFLHVDLGLHPGLSLAIRFTVCFLLLCIPTAFMGATLPVLGRFVETGYESIGRRLGGLYAVNTLGAVIGSFGTGYVLIGLAGIRTTTLSAALMNLLLALLAFLLSKERRAVLRFEDPARKPLQRTSPDGVRNAVRMGLAASFVSGFTALAYEVLWMRVLVPVLSSSTYSFSTMLGAFLAGLAAGSGVFSMLADRTRSPFALLGWTQILVAALTLVSTYSFGLYFRLFPSQLTIPLESMGIGSFFISFLYFFVILVPPCFFMGAVFPVVIKIISRSGLARLGSLVGIAYSINTLGAILGSIAAGFVLAPFLGVQRSFILLISANALLGLILLAAHGTERGKTGLKTLLSFPAAVVILFLTLGGENTFKKVLTLQVHEILGPHEFLYYREGATATTSAVKDSSGAPRLLVNSIIVTGKCLSTKLMGHLPALLHPNPSKSLVICFGMGTTFRSLAAHGLEVKAVELVPEVVETFPLFYEDAGRLMGDPRLKIEINDGRNHLLLTRESYDVITVDPSPPLYSSGTVSLLTPEFYRLCREHLTPDGVMCMWLFLPSCTMSEFQMLLKSFMIVFPHTTVWRSPDSYGVFVIGTREKPFLDLESMARRIRNEAVQNDLKEVLPRGVVFTEKELLDLFMLHSPRAWSLVRDAPDLTDNTPLVEHPLVNWWFDPLRLDMNRFFRMESDNYRHIVK